MKGLLKGLKYISQMFEHEKEPEIQIGMPTDVKHVAHIGLDGPSAVNTAPSWMNEFETPPEGLQSAPSPQDSQRMSGKNPRGKSSSARDKPEVPKSSKSTTKKTKKPKDPNQVTESTSKDTKKNSKRKKLKDSNGEGSSRRYRNIQDLDTVSETETESQYSCASDFIEREDT